MKAYRVKGVFLMGKVWQPFSKEVIGNDENEAVERLLSTIGSRHGVKRRMIKIKEIKEIDKEEIQDDMVKYMIEKVEE